MLTLVVENVPVFFLLLGGNLTDMRVAIKRNWKSVILLMFKGYSVILCFT